MGHCHRRADEDLGDRNDQAVPSILYAEGFGSRSRDGFVLSLFYQSKTRRSCRPRLLQWRSGKMVLSNVAGHGGQVYSTGGRGQGFEGEMQEVYRIRKDGGSKETGVRETWRSSSSTGAPQLRS